MEELLLIPKSNIQFPTPEPASTWTKGSASQGTCRLQLSPFFRTSWPLHFLKSLG